MSTVFIGGSRKISRLPAEVIARIEGMIAQDFAIVVGDANGADKAVQGYLASRSYARVEVFCSGDCPRNNVGGWPLRAVAVPRGARGFAFYTHHIGSRRVVLASARSSLRVSLCPGLGADFRDRSTEGGR